MTRLEQLFDEYAQCPWLDNLTRSYLRDGTLARVIADGTPGCHGEPHHLRPGHSGLRRLRRPVPLAHHRGQHSGRRMVARWRGDQRRDATRRGLMVRNVAVDAHAPKRRSSETTELRAWNAQQLRAFLDLAETHRLFPAFWLAANTGMRRSELLGLRWDDLDLDATRLSVNRALISVAYELHESAGKTRNSRRMIDLDTKTVTILRDWQEDQQCEHEKLGIEHENGYVFTKPDGGPVHPDVFRQTFDRLVARAGVPRIRLHDLRHTHATLLLKERIPTKVVSERLGHATPAFTMVTYQHVMQAEAARVFAGLLEPSPGFHPVEDR
jgi:integrase